MQYDFDTVQNRFGTGSEKYDFILENGHREDVLPMWVADMDFQTAPEVIAALHACVAHGIFGYTSTKRDYFDAVAAWQKKYFGWEIQEEWLVKTPGVVNAIATAVRTYTQTGDAVLLSLFDFH